VKFGERDKSSERAMGIKGFGWGLTRFDQTLTKVDH
jgi:hypothetical protein